jgi:hypothetical protein
VYWLEFHLCNVFGYWPEPRWVYILFLNAASQVPLFHVFFLLHCCWEIGTNNLIWEHDVSVQILVQLQGLAFAFGVCCKKVVWNSIIVQLTEIMWKLTSPVAVLLVLYDQFYKCYCWTLYWEMNPAHKVKWGLNLMGEDEWFWNEWQQDVPIYNSWLLYSRISLIWHLWDQTGADYCTVFILTWLLKNNFSLQLLYWGAQLIRGVFHLIVSCRCWCFEFYIEPVHLSITFISSQNDWTFVIIIGPIMGFPSERDTLNHSYNTYVRLC